MGDITTELTQRESNYLNGWRDPNRWIREMRGFASSENRRVILDCIDFPNNGYNQPHTATEHVNFYRLLGEMEARVYSHWEDIQKTTEYSSGPEKIKNTQYFLGTEISIKRFLPDHVSKNGEGTLLHALACKQIGSINSWYGNLTDKTFQSVKEDVEYRLQKEFFHHLCGKYFEVEDSSINLVTLEYHKHDYGRRFNFTAIYEYDYS